MIRKDDWSTMRRLLLTRGAAGGALKEYEVEGNPAVFQTNVAKPLAGFTIPFYPIQTGSGDPSPQNIRPISGRSGLTAYRTGKNLWDEKWETGALSQDGSLSSTDTRRTTSFIPVVPNTTYRQVSPNNAYGGRIAYYNREKECTYFSNNGISAGAQTFTTDADTYFVRVTLGSGYGTTYNDDISFNYPSTATEYAPYTGAAYQVTFPAQGKNLCPPFVKGVGINANNGSEIQNATFATTDYIPVNFSKNPEYSLSGMEIQLISYIGAYNAQKQFVGRTSGTQRAYDHLTETSFPNGTDKATGEIAFLRVAQYEGSTGKSIDLMDDAKVQLEAGSTITTYEPYAGNTIYGGTFEAATGVLTVEWAFANLNSESAWGSYGTGDSFLVYLTISDMKVGNRLPGYCDMFPSTYTATSANLRFGADDNVIRTSNINKLGITDLSEWKEFIGADGINVCYPLATPIEIQLDPLTISTLIGDNTIWTDTDGSNTIKYKKKG